MDLHGMSREDLINQQGWSPDTMGELALEFIDGDPDSQAAFLIFLSVVATFENDVSDVYNGFTADHWHP